MPESAAPPKPKRLRRTQPAATPATPVEQSSILRDAGAAAMTGLHTVGSILSTPSRLLWGTANALAGGEGGFGNLNPLDSTGGIELSKFLANQGVIAQNDPNAWEWGDLGRGLLDIAGDPLSYVAPLALTKAGQAASKAGTLTKGIVPQIAKGERALVGLQVPFATKATGVIGTGEGAAKVASTVGKGLKPIAESAPVRGLRRLFDYRAGGAKGVVGQAAAGEYHEGLRPELAENARLVQAAALNTAGMSSASAQQTLRQSLERLDPGQLQNIEPRGSLNDIHDRLAANIEENASLGLPANKLDDDVTNLIDRGWDDRLAEAKRQGLEQLQAGKITDLTHHLDRAAADATQYMKDHVFDLFEDADKAKVNDEVNKIIADRLTGLDLFLKRNFPDRRNDLITEALRGVRQRMVGEPSLPFSVADSRKLSSGEIAEHLGKIEADFAAQNPRHKINYISRHMGHAVRNALGKGSSVFGRTLSVQTPEQLARNPALQGFAEGSEAINRIVKDANAEAIIQQSVKRGIPPEDTAGEVMQYIQDTYKGQFIDEFIDPVTKEVSHRSRVLAEMMVGSPEIRKLGLFTNSPLVDVHNALDRQTKSIRAAKVALKTMAQHSKESFPEEFASAAASVNNPLYHGFIDPTIARPVVESGAHVSIRDALNKLGFDPENLNAAALHMARQKGTPAAETYAKAIDWATAHGMVEDIDGILQPTAEATELAAKAVLDRRVSTPLVEDLLRLKPEWKLPEELSTPAKLWKGYTAAFKAGVLTAPARDVRDLTGGQVNNAMRGWFSPRATMDAQAIFNGQGVEGYINNPAVREFIESNELPKTEEGVSEALRRIYAMYHPGRVSISSELDEAGYAASGVEDILQAVPGRTPSSNLENIASVGRTALGQSQTPEGWQFQRGNLNPLGIPGISDIPQATFGPVKANQAVTDWVDYQNRMTAFLTRLRNGETDIPKMMDEIDFAQVNYDPNRFTPTEKALREVFPFYKFYSRQGAYVAGQLAANPAGRMAQTIKAVDRQSSGDPSVPDIVLSGTNIPLGQDETGARAYLTGLGLMHETPGELLGQAAAGDIQSLGYNVLGMAHPLIKGPLEAVTGQSFFREGEPLSNLDPTVGRLLSNIGETTGLRDESQGPVYFPGSGTLDQIIGNSPLSRYATSARTAFDPRRKGALGAAEKALILGSGVRITRQSAEGQRKTLRKRLDDLAVSEGSRVGVHGPYATDAQLAANPRLKQIIAVRRQLDREAQRDRRKKLKRQT